MLMKAGVSYVKVDGKMSSDGVDIFVVICYRYDKERRNEYGIQM